MTPCRPNLFAAAVVATLGIGNVRADTLLVPVEYPTIQHAIEAAEDGDEIVLADMTFTDAGNKDLLFQGKTLTVRSASGNRASCRIDCDGVGRFARIFGDDTVVVRSITIENGDVDTAFGGAALLDSGSDATFEDCAFEACTAARGGAVYVDAADVTFDGCRFTGNACAGGGGAVRGVGGALLICTGSSFEGNSAETEGGAVYLGEIDPASRISRCRFTNNTGNGGGLSINADGTYVVTECLFEGNVSPFGGGAIRLLYAGPPSRVQDCVFRNNTAGRGGAVVIAFGASPTFVNCLFDGNESSFDCCGENLGGGISVGNSTPAIVNCTFVNNHSDDLGGAVGVHNDAHPELVNCILWGNDAPCGNEITVGHPDQGSPAAVTVSFSDVMGGEKGVCIIDGTLDWGDGNIDEDPFFDDYSCPTEGSSVIDAGHDAAVPGDVTDDIHGRPRFVDGDGDGTATVDMGACEYQTCPADLDRDGAVAFGDVIEVLANWGPYEACPPYVAQDLDFDCNVGFGDVLAVLAAWGSCP